MLHIFSSLITSALNPSLWNNFISNIIKISNVWYRNREVCNSEILIHCFVLYRAESCSNSHTQSFQQLRLWWCSVTVHCMFCISALYDVMNQTHFSLMLTSVSASFLTLKRSSSTALCITDSSSESSLKCSDFLIVKNVYNLRSISFISSSSLIEHSWISISWCCILLLAVDVSNSACFSTSLIDIIDLDEELNSDCHVLLLTVAAFNSACFSTSSIDIIDLNKELNSDCCILLLTVADSDSVCFSASSIDVISLNEELNSDYCVLLLTVAAFNSVCFSAFFVDIIGLDEELNSDYHVFLLTVAVFNSVCFSASSIDIISLDKELNSDYCVLLLTVAVSDSICFFTSWIDIIDLSKELNLHIVVLFSVMKIFKSTPELVAVLKITIMSCSISVMMLSAEVWDSIDEDDFDKWILTFSSMSLFLTRNSVSVSFKINAHKSESASNIEDLKIRSLEMMCCSELTDL